MSKPTTPTAPAGKGFFAERFDYFKSDPMSALKVWEHFTTGSKEELAAAKDAQDSVRGFGKYLGADKDAETKFETSLKAMDATAFLVKTADGKEFKIVEGLRAAKSAMMITRVKNDLMAKKLEDDKTIKDDKAKLDQAEKDTATEAKTLCEDYLKLDATKDKTTIDAFKADPKHLMNLAAKAEKEVLEIITNVDAHLKIMAPKFDPKDPNYKPVSKNKMVGMAALLGGATVLLALAVTLMIVSKAVSAKSLADFMQTAVSKVTFGNVTPSINACGSVAKVITSNPGLAAAGFGAFASAASMCALRFEVRKAGLEYAGHKNQAFQQLAEKAGQEKVLEVVAPAPGKA